jgi:hypothetical protein
MMLRKDALTLTSTESMRFLESHVPSVGGFVLFCDRRSENVVSFLAMHPNHILIITTSSLFYRVLSSTYLAFYLLLVSVKFYCSLYFLYFNQMVHRSMPLRAMVSRTMLAKELDARKLASRVSALKVLAARKLAAMTLGVEPFPQSPDPESTSEDEESPECSFWSLTPNSMAPEPAQLPTHSLRAVEESDGQTLDPYCGLTPNSMAPPPVTMVALFPHGPGPELLAPAEVFDQTIYLKNVSEPTLNSKSTPTNTAIDTTNEVPKDSVAPIPAPKKTFGPISFPAPMNDECTFENALYPFKLVLSPAEERPLETGMPIQQQLTVSGNLDFNMPAECHRSGLQVYHS